MGGGLLKALPAACLRHGGGFIKTQAGLCLHVLAPLWEKRSETFQVPAVVCRDGLVTERRRRLPIEPSVAQDDAAVKPGAESLNFSHFKIKWMGGGPWTMLPGLQRCQEKKK